MAAPPGAVADSLIQTRVEVVMDQHRAVAQAEQDRVAEARRARASGFDPLGKPLGDLSAEGTDASTSAVLGKKDGQLYLTASTPVKRQTEVVQTESNRPIAPTLAEKRAAQAEEDRRRLETLLRQGEAERDLDLARLAYRSGELEEALRISRRALSKCDPARDGDLMERIERGIERISSELAAAGE